MASSPAASDPALTLLTLFAFLAIGAVAGVLAGLLGIGGGAVIVPALIWLFDHLVQAGWGARADLVPQIAVATSLATVVATGGASTLAHQRRGAVDWALVGRLAPGLLLGAWLGAVGAAWLPGAWLQRLFAVFLFYSGVRMILRARVAEQRALAGGLAVTAVAAVFGALSALLGIGGGTLVVPFLARHGVLMRRAVATASACGVPLALAGSVGFLVAGWGRDGLPAHSLGFVLWPAALAIMAASVPLAPVGAWLAHRLPTATVKRGFGVLLLVVAGELAVGG